MSRYAFQKTLIQRNISCFKLENADILQHTRELLEQARQVAVSEMYLITIPVVFCTLLHRRPQPQVSTTKSSINKYTHCPQSNTFATINVSLFLFTFILFSDLIFKHKKRNLVRKPFNSKNKFNDITSVTT